MSTDGINPLKNLPAVTEDIPVVADEPKREVREESVPVETPQREKAAAKEALELSLKQVEEMTQVLNESAKLFNVSLRFRIDRETNRIIVTVIDRETEEVIRQVPPEELIQFSKRMEGMTGVLFNETA